MNRREMMGILAALILPAAVHARKGAVPSGDQFNAFEADGGYQILSPQGLGKRLVIQWGSSDADGFAKFPVEMRPLSMTAGVEFKETGTGLPVPITQLGPFGAYLKPSEYWIAIGELI